MTPLEIVKELYAKLTAGDASGALALMSGDIEWIAMMDYKIDGRGPQKVFEGMLVPAMPGSQPRLRISNPQLRQAGCKQRHDKQTVAEAGLAPEKLSGTRRAKLTTPREANSAFSELRRQIRHRSTAVALGLPTSGGTLTNNAWEPEA